MFTPHRLSIITHRDRIRSAREFWFSTYQCHLDHAVTGWSDRTFGDVRRALLALDVDTCSERDIDEAVGMPCWAGLKCGVCDSSVALIVRVGDADDWQDICQKCLDDASDLARDAVSELPHQGPLLPL